MPVICAVNGICWWWIRDSLSCDLIICSENATFALPEIRSGTVADAASIKLPKEYRIMLLWNFVDRGGLMPKRQCRMD